jgi:hypothetical protein
MVTIEFGGLPVRSSWAQSRLPSHGAKSPSPIGSVVIPAHNEAAVIGRCLDALFDGIEPSQLEVVVACNGCTDSTADVAKASGHPVEVVSLDAASKPAALRAAERVATVFPRIYLDADIVLCGSSALAVVNCLRSGPPFGARPPIRYDSRRSSLPVRSYYRARSRIPAVMNSLWGAGVYGLSEKGRARFGEYPDVVADDLFVDQHFSPDEIEVVDCEPAVITPPARVRDLMSILRRTYRGKTENRLDGPVEGGRETVGSTVKDIGRLATVGPIAALDAATYSAFAISARLAVKLVPAAGWERDNSSRGH